MPGDISKSYQGPKDGSVPSWMDEPSPPTLQKPGQETISVTDMRAGINILLETIAQKFEANDTLDIWRSDAASLVRSYKHPAP